MSRVNDKSNRVPARSKISAIFLAADLAIGRVNASFEWRFETRHLPQHGLVNLRAGAGLLAVPVRDARIHADG